MKAYLKPLKIYEGLFSSEKGVRIKDFTGEETSGFFESKHIKKGKLEVAVISEKGNLVLVELSGRTLEGVGDKGYITVNREQLITVNREQLEYST